MDEVDEITASPDVIELCDDAKISHAVYYDDTDLFDIKLENADYFGQYACSLAITDSVTGEQYVLRDKINYNYYSDQHAFYINKQNIVGTGVDKLLASDHDFTIRVLSNTESTPTTNDAGKPFVLEPCEVERKKLSDEFELGYDFDGFTVFEISRYNRADTWLENKADGMTNDFLTDFLTFNWKAEELDETGAVAKEVPVLVGNGYGSPFTNMATVMNPEVGKNYRLTVSAGDLAHSWLIMFIDSFSYEDSSEEGYPVQVQLD